MMLSDLMERDPGTQLSEQGLHGISWMHLMTGKMVPEPVSGSVRS